MDIRLVCYSDSIPQTNSLVARFEGGIQQRVEQRMERRWLDEAGGRGSVVV